VWKDLHEAGERVSEKRVGRLMREDGLRARVRKRFRSTTMSEHDQPVAANVLARQFVAERPNERWVGDTTEFTLAAARSSIWRPSSISIRGSSWGGP
jgi:transposase InsO family protein